MSQSLDNEDNTSNVIQYSVGSVQNMGIVNQHDPDTNIKYTWFSFIPRSIRLGVDGNPVQILLVCANATMSDEYESAIQEMYGCIQGRSEWAEKYGYVLITPVIPRDLQTPIYAVAFDKRVFTNVDIFFQRPDLEVVKMIEVMKEALINSEVEVKEKIFIEGFSAGGMFAQRFALLHPEMVQAIAVGQCGGALTLPVEEYNGVSMDWPLGIRDFSDLTGSPFNLEAYRQIAQYIYIGGKDNSNSTVHYGNEIWSDSQVDVLNLFGDTDPKRIQTQVEYMNSLGFTNIQFALYPGYKHEYHDDQIADLFAFFEENK